MRISFVNITFPPFNVIIISRIIMSFELFRGFGNKYTTRTIGSKLGCPTVPSWGETIGSIVGFIGMGITVLDVSSDKEATFLGDFVAFLGKCSVIQQTQITDHPCCLCNYFFLPVH